MKNKKPILRTIAVLILATVIFATQSSVVNGISQSMINGTSPSVQQSTAPSEKNWHVLILSQHGKVQSVKVGMYFTDANSDKNFRIRVKTGGKCRINYLGTAYGRRQDYAYVVIGNSPKIGISGEDICDPNGLDNRLFTITQAQLQAAGRDAGSNLYKIEVTIRWVAQGDNTNSYPNIRSDISTQPDPSDPTSESKKGSQFWFKFRTDIMGQTGARVGYINSSQSTENDPNNSFIFARDDTSDDEFAQVYYPFGPSCEVKDDAHNQVVSLYDADNGTASQTPPMRFYIGTVNASGTVTPLRVNEYQGQGGGAATSLADIKVGDAGGSRTASDGSSLGPVRTNTDGFPAFVPGYFNNRGGVTQVWIREFKKRTHYVLVARPVHEGQFLYVGLPGDAIFGSPDYDFDANCPVPTNNSLDPEAGFDNSQYEVGDTATANASVIGNGTGSVSSNYTRRFWYRNTASLDPYGSVNGDSLARANITGNGTFNNGTTTLPATGLGAVPARSFICTSLELTSTPSGVTIVAPNPEVVCVPIVRRPYFKVFNGDANASAVFESAGSCNVTAAGGPLSGFNLGAPGYAGTGAQVGVFAAGDVNGVVSGYRMGSLPNSLAFANTDATLEYGGNFHDTFCVPLDDWNGIDESTDSNVVSGGNIGPGGSLEVHVPGDVYITGDINFTGSYDTTNIPHVKIVAEGDIYISSSVSSLSGIFETTGNIYTCAVNNGSGGLRQPTSAEMRNSCGSPLTVTGVVVAQEIYLLRTSGSVTGSPGQTETPSNTAAAERFIFSPEAWLDSLYNGRRTPSGNQNYQTDSFQSLPPIL